jgi:D-threo-aldose 1-dehydrogenase
LQKLKSEGEVVGVGVGAKDWTSIRELGKYCDFDWVMFANSFTVMQHPKELETFMSELADKQIAIINSALFHGGFLLGGEYFDYRLLQPGAAEDRSRLDWRSKFQTICERHKVTPFDAGVAFGAAHPAVNAIALSSGRADRVPTHVAVLKKNIPNELWVDLKDAGLIRRDLSMLP